MPSRRSASHNAANAATTTSSPSSFTTSAANGTTTTAASSSSSTTTLTSTSNSAKTPSGAVSSSQQHSSPSIISSSTHGKHAPSQSPRDIALRIWRAYLDTTPQRTKLIDLFMAFLVGVGVVQFVYCVLAGNYPFNAFLSGFCVTVGQFVLTASLRIQTTGENKADFSSLSPERAFADYVFGSLILHFFCVNFIN